MVAKTTRRHLMCVASRKACIAWACFGVLSVLAGSALAVMAKLKFTPFAYEKLYDCGNGGHGVLSFPDPQFAACVNRTHAVAETLGRLAVVVVLLILVCFVTACLDDIINRLFIWSDGNVVNIYNITGVFALASAVGVIGAIAVICSQLYG